jgi:hypothetical protein
MFYKFGDNTKSKTIIKKGEEVSNDTSSTEIYDEDDKENRRSIMLKKQIEKVVEDK